MEITMLPDFLSSMHNIYHEIAGIFISYDEVRIWKL